LNIILFGVIFNEGESDNVLTEQVASLLYSNIVKRFTHAHALKAKSVVNIFKVKSF